MEIAFHDFIAGAIGLGMIAKGLLDHTVSKKQNGSNGCQFRRTDVEHLDNMVERILMKVEECCGKR